MNTITTAQLKKKYGVEDVARFRMMLQCLDILGYAEKGSQRYPVKDILPEEAWEVRRAYESKFLTATLEEVLSGAVSEVTDLRDDMESWRDNMSGTGLENTDKFSQVEDAVSTLDGAVYELEAVQEAVTDTFSDSMSVSMTVVPAYDTRLLTGRNRILGRQKRLANATGALEQVLGILTDNLETAREEVEAPEDNDDILDKETVVNYLENAISELESVDFPGMF